MSVKKVIAIDFDGTITEPSEYPITGKIRPEAIRVIKRLQEKYICCLWTCRSGTDLRQAMNLLHKWGVYFSFINCSPYKERGSTKIWADYYIDDKNLGTKIDWLQIEKMLLGEE